MSKLTDVILEQMERLASDPDRFLPEAELIRTWVEELGKELTRLQKIEDAVIDGLKAKVPL